MTNECDDIGLGALPTENVAQVEGASSTKGAESLMKSIASILSRIFPDKELKKYAEKVVATCFDTTSRF